jgi:LPS sulfotransferase NodH
MQGTGTSVVPSKPRNASARSKAPVFVLGCPRSGTTLLYHMLLSAGNFVMYRSESQVFNLLEPRCGDLSSMRNKRKFLATWQGSNLFQKTGLTAAEVEPEVLANCHNAGDFLRIVMEAMARAQGVERWADCTPEHLLSLTRIKETIPNALAIHIIRDGRDVALSMEKQKWIRPFPWDRRKGLLAAALYWEWIVNKGREQGKELEADYREIHYEDLVSNPREVLAQLGDFVEQELDYDHIQQVGIGSVSKPNSSFKAEPGGGEFKPVARWKTSLSNDSLRDLDCVLGQTLAELGYAVDPAAADAPNRGALERMRGLYHGYFEGKHTLKTRTPLGRWFASRDLSWV